MQDSRDAPVSPKSNGPSKSRSFSDPPTAPAALAPSPNFRESLRRTSKDDYAVPTTPRIRRPDFTHGLSLQMPGRDMLSPAQLQRPAVPLSPQLDANNIHAVVQSGSQAGSPVTSLPRHSRGLDFSRASTNLHHSTLAEQSSPDLSPIITQKGMAIPARKMSSMALDSPNIGLGGMWTSLGQGRSAVSSSVGSVNMLVSESESASSDDDASMGDEQDDPIFTTPQVHKLHNQAAATPFQHPIEGTVFGDTSAQSPAAASLLRTIRKSRLNKTSRRTGKSSSSASNSGYSSMASPRTTSPPPIKSIESMGHGYFGRPKSRRESLAFGTDSLHLSSGNDSGDEANTAPSTPGVVRRPVTRRGNLLPKTKGFARIRATLIEEASPIDTDTRREAETIRQVRERDSSIIHFDHLRNALPTAPSSPSLLPAVPELAQSDFGRELDAEATPMSKGLGVNFQLHMNRHSIGRLDSSAGTPPPNFSRQSSTMTSDAIMDSPSLAPHDAFQRVRGRAHSNASDISEVMAQLSGPNTVMNDDMHLKKFKRRREDDYDIATVKRRAVSPGMSTQNSPILTHSPYQREGNWGLPPAKKDREITTASSDASMSSQIPPPVRSSSNGSVGTPTNLCPGKKLGQRGMTDTNDGLMKMSIE